jgi:hypothetical protein
MQYAKDSPLSPLCLFAWDTLITGLAILFPPALLQTTRSTDGILDCGSFPEASAAKDEADAPGGRARGE